MRSDLHDKVTPRHLTRSAYLYVRQSTLHQVAHHTESARRQYDLQERALALGWGQEQIIIVDIDQGQSGSTADRIGFQKLVSEVGMGHAGLVMGLEVSRLARNSADWHRLLEICALSDTLILDEDGLYNPGHFNDRLLLGLKGTMSEAELHVLRARLQGGLLNKAKRGELRIPLPIGFVYNDQGAVVLDPNLQVQEAIRVLFATFRRVGSALGTARLFRKEGLLFPCRKQGWKTGSRPPARWKDLDISTVLRLLQNPRYAGIYCFGRTRQYRTPEGRYICQRLPKDDWCAWIPAAHEAYITQQEHEENLQRLAENGRAYGADRRSPPREGSALLQGIVLCKKCGRKMAVHYHRRQGEMVPSYVCARKEEGGCQTIHGSGIDEAVGELLVDLMSPMTLEVSLSIQQELEQRFEQTEQLRRKQVDQARYEANLARQRFLLVDPNNRLVAASLEAEWNEKLKLLTAAEEEFDRRCTEDGKLLDDKQKSEIQSLAGDFSRLWKDPQTPSRERKRMARLLIEDVTLEKEGREITVHVRFKAGATKTLALKTPSTAPERFKANPDLVEEVDRLLDHHTEEEIADLLNQRDLTPPRGQTFTQSIVASIRMTYKLRSRSHRLREQGHLTPGELASKLRVGVATLQRWERRGLLQVHYCGRLRFYEDPVFEATPEEVRDRLRTAFSERSSQPATNEVQYEA